MQTKKDNVRNEILNVARIELCNKGFKDASMRSIASKAGVTLSNIYNYFKNKNEILCEVLNPVLQSFEKLREEHNKPEYASINYFFSERYQAENIEMFVDFILKFKDELNLLLFKSHGSSFGNFRDEFTNEQTKTGAEYMQLMKQKHPEVNVVISEFFVHTLSSWWLTIIGEIVSHDLSNDEIKTFIAEYVKFSTAGWKKMFGV